MSSVARRARNSESRGCRTGHGHQIDVLWFRVVGVLVGRRRRCVLAITTIGARRARATIASARTEANNQMSCFQAHRTCAPAGASALPVIKALNSDHARAARSWPESRADSTRNQHGPTRSTRKRARSRRTSGARKGTPPVARSERGVPRTRPGTVLALLPRQAALLPAARRRRLPWSAWRSWSLML